MKAYMICFTNGQFVKVTADDLKEDENNSVILFIDKKVIGVFYQSNIAGWIKIEEKVF